MQLYLSNKVHRRNNTTWSTLANDVINGYEITEEEALSILNSSDGEILQLL